MPATLDDSQHTPPSATYQQVELLTQNLRLLISAQLQSLVDLVWTRYELLVASGLPQARAVEIALERLPRYHYLQGLAIEDFEFEAFAQDLRHALRATLPHDEPKPQRRTTSADKSAASETLT